MSNISNQQILRRQAEPIFISANKTDINSPLSYKEWVASHQGIVPGLEFKQYNEYLVNWYKNKSLTVVDNNLQIKLNYLNLLKQLQLFFSIEEAENWYNKVNVDDEKELLLAIPYFAKKLKDISFYYLELRKKIKETRLRYNQTGTNVGLIQQIQNIILKNYSKTNNGAITLPSTLWADIPELSALNTNLAIQLEELYDFQDYFDKSPTTPLSSFIDVNSEDLKNFLLTKNLLLSSTDWIYKLGFNSLSSSDEEIFELSKKLSEKYLGEDKFLFSETPTLSTKTDVYDISIINGNNSFYWPGVVYDTKALSLTRYEPVALSSLGLETLATAGSSIEFADTIFVKSVLGTQGAWLRNHLFDFKNLTMTATLDSSIKTTFRFPFPGIGLSGEDLEWTGFGLQTDKRYEFLEENIKRGIEELYWSTTTEASSINPLSINNSTLIENKAYAHKNYNHSDRIKVWFITPEYNETSVSDAANEAWLYRFDKTDISVGAGQENVIYWPYEKINTENDFPSYYPETMSDVCSPINLSDIDLQFAIAGNTLSSSDVIYKINNYKQGTESAVECSWLSGSLIENSSEEIRFIDQSSLQLILSAGQYSYFTWTGNDYTLADNVFKSLQHQPDCKFVNAQYSSYLDHEKCSCSVTNFTPFGHPGNIFTDNKSLTDFIIEDNFSPKILNLGNWKDSYNTNYLSSSAFGWFKTNTTIGWGDGSWVCGDEQIGNRFYLRNGKKYIYFRSNIKHIDPEINSLPNYALKYKYPNKQNSSVWVNAKKDETGNWINEGSSSSMILNPGDLLIYSRKNSTHFTLTGTEVQDIDVAENRGSIWSNYDYVSLGNNRSIIVSYPFNVPPTDDKQNPKVNFTNILRYYNWRVSGPIGNPLSSVANFTNQSSFLFLPQLSGIYTVTLSALSGNPATTINGSYTLSGIYTFTDIPAITAIPSFTLVESLTSYSAGAPSYVINVPLKGWDYNTNTFNNFSKKANQGAKPFWAKIYNDKDEFTGFKGIESIGNVLRLTDDYNIISQPEFSDIVFNMGNKIEYYRNYPVKMNWVQPIDFEILIDQNNWCTLEFNTTAESNLTDYIYNNTSELVVNPTSKHSNISITNFIDNHPVEIVYNAMNSFTWSVSVVPQISETVYKNISANLDLKATSPWTNLANLSYPTVAAIPSIDNLYSQQEIGGFFAPNNLGASKYINQNYTTHLEISSQTTQNYFENIKERFNARGLTKESSNTPYVLDSENNLWIKESNVSSSTAGTTKKEIFKKYQKFLPYQSGYESNPRLKVGLVTPSSKQTPWTGKEDSEWGDISNYPISFTGELKTSKWVNDQVLKKSGLQAENWVTDIYGNQYALYKNIKNVPSIQRKNVYGEIWTRKNSQFVSSASNSLVGVFDTYSNTTLIHELTGKGIKKIDVFFDTLMIETSGAVIFEKLIYDYNTDNIFSLTDEARYISLAMPLSINLDREFNNVDVSNYNFAKAGETWFFPKEKIVSISTCSVENKKIVPELYSLNLNSVVLEKIFPLIDTDITLINSLSSENIISVESPTLSYNSFSSEYILSVLCKTEENNDLLLELIIKNNSRPFIKNCTIYKSKPKDLSLNPPIIQHSLHVYITNKEELNFQSYADNGPVTYSVIEKPDWVKVSSNGLFTGTPPTIGTYKVTFTVTNSYGPVYYTLYVYVEKALIIDYLYTSGYTQIGDEDGFILSEPEIGTGENKIILNIIES